MADEPNDPWSSGVTAGDADPPWDPTEADAEDDDTARQHTGRWTSPSLGSYDPASTHEALQEGDGADDAYFRDFGYGEGFGDGRLAAGFDPDAEVASAPAPDAAPRPEPAGPTEPNGRRAAAETNGTGSHDRTWVAPTDRSGATGRFDPRAVAPAADAPRTWSAADGIDSADPFDDLDDPDGAEEAESGTDTTRNMIEWAVVLVGAVLLALVLRALVLQAFWIPSPSMESTLLVRDRVLVNKVSYRVGDIGRGDIIVFRRTDEEIAQNPELPRDVIKRVIALEGEEIEILDNQVFIDGLLLQEPYLDEGVTTTDFGPETVPDGHVFVMGDNRELSLDSRFETGPIAEDRVVGRAFFLFWPLNRIGSL